MFQRAVSVGPTLLISARSRGCRDGFSSSILLPVSVARSNRSLLHSGSESPRWTCATRPRSSASLRRSRDPEWLRPSGGALCVRPDRARRRGPARAAARKAQL